MSDTVNGAGSEDRQASETQSQGLAKQQDSRSPKPTDRPAAFQTSNYVEVEGSHKRKRTHSPEIGRSPLPQERTPDTATGPIHAMSREEYVMPSREDRYSRESHHDGRVSQRAREERSPYDSVQSSATSPHGHSEEQLGEALRRATSQDYPPSSPEEEDRSITVYDGSYGSDKSSMLQHDPKKRKRNFSNRTKTGCLTCRKRKKKCDELKPECK